MIFGVNPLTIVISGPLGTVAGRVVLGGISGTNPLALIAAAVPGMVFTAVGAAVIYPVMKRLVRREAAALAQP